jgi:hypothetical protein
MLRKLILVFTLCLLTFPALCQSASKWKIAAITEVKPHPATGEDASDPTTYDISVKVGDTIYLVRYTTPAGEIAPKYATVQAQQTNQITHEQAEYLLQQRYKMAMMQYQVLSALHDVLKHDIDEAAGHRQGSC